MKKSIIIISLIAVCAAAIFAGCSSKKNDMPTTTTLTTETTESTTATTNKVEEALTNGLENFAVPREEIPARVDEALDAMVQIALKHQICHANLF